MKRSFKLKRNKQESTAVICTLTGKDEEKQEARETYEVAKANGQTAQLMEVQVKKAEQIFRGSLGKVPKSCAKIKITVGYLQSGEL